MSNLARQLKIAFVCLAIAGFAAIARGQDLPLAAPPVTSNTQDPAEAEVDEQDELTFRDVLAARGVDASQLRHMFDDRPFSLDERETLERTLAALINLPPDQIGRYAVKMENLPGFMADPDEHRGKLVQVDGRVIGCRGITVVPELHERLGFSVIFHCTVAVSVGSGEQYQCDVFSPIAPLQWLPRADGGKPELDETVHFDAVFLKRAGDVAGTATHRPVLATRRLAWYPKTLLGEAGFDVASLEEVAPEGKIVTSDAPAFHGLLSAMRKLSPAELQSAAMDTLSHREVRGTSLEETSRRLMVGFMADARSWRGEIVQLQGIARRALKIHVDDPELINKYGTREYFEVDVFVEGPFRLPGFDEVVARYPVTFCTSELPAGIPEGDRLSIPVQLSGVYLKNWRYTSAKFVAAEAGQQRAPLIIGGALERTPSQAVDSGAPWGTREFALAAVLFLLVLAAAYICWRWGTRDRAAAQRRAIVLQKQRE